MFLNKNNLIKIKVKFYKPSYILQIHFNQNKAFRRKPIFLLWDLSYAIRTIFFNEIGV
jgi:hypothetical protein